MRPASFTFTCHELRVRINSCAYVNKCCAAHDQMESRHFLNHNLMHCKNFAWKLHHELNFSTARNATPPPSLTSVDGITHRQWYSSFVKKKRHVMCAARVYTKCWLLNITGKKRRSAPNAASLSSSFAVSIAACRLKVTTVLDYSK